VWVAVWSPGRDDMCGWLCGLLVGMVAVWSTGWDDMCGWLCGLLVGMICVGGYVVYWLG